MTKIKFPKPDYKFWTKTETWSLNQAAFLLHGIDPHQVRSVRLAEHDVPPEFTKVQKTYFLLRSVPWREQHSSYYLPNRGVHPIAIIVEAKKKELPIPKVLYKAVAARYQREQKEEEEYRKEKETLELKAAKEKAQAENKAIDKQSLSTRERRNFLKAIGILVRLVFDGKNKAGRYSRGDKLNAYQIAQALLDKAEELGLETEGLKSLDRKITEALELLDEEIESS